MLATTQKDIDEERALAVCRKAIKLVNVIKRSVRLITCGLESHSLNKYFKILKNQSLMKV